MKKMIIHMKDQEKMKQLDILKALCIGAAILTLTNSVTAAPEKSSEKPNVIYILLDE